MINTKHRLRITLIQIVLLSAIVSISTVFGEGTGLIRIDPAIPRVVSSPAEFTIWVQNGETAYDPHIFLVMTQTSYDSFSGNVRVSWVDGVVAGYVDLWKEVDWTMASGSDKLPPGTTPGAGYTIASLKSHLSETTEDIWWAFAPILENPLDGTNKTITITFPATSPHMIVYILGRSTENGDLYDTEYDMKVPPTIPGGFLIPEVPYGTIATLITMLGAFYVFYAKRA